MTATLPVALLVLVWWKRGGLRRVDVMGLLPLLFFAITFGTLTAFIEARYIGAYGPDFDFGFARRCLIAGRAVWFYLNAFLDPHGHLFIYPRWNLDAHSVLQWLPVAAVFIVVAALFFSRKKIGRGAVTAAFLFILGVAPALGFINFYPMYFSFVADHFAYIGTIILCTVFAGLLGMIGRRLSASQAVMQLAAR